MEKNTIVVDEFVTAEETPQKTKLEINKDEILSNVFSSEDEEKEQKKYHSIIRHGKAGTNQTVENDAFIVVQEKLDGANASFKKENGKIRVFSRNQELSEHNTLNGFYNWVMEKFTPVDLLPSFVYFGEWLTPHKIDYGKDNMKEFYLFDIYNEVAEEYCDFDDVKEEAEELDVKLVPVHYIGKYQDYAHLESFIGKSLLNPEVDAEGIVVKNVDYKRGGVQMFTKLVSAKFAEMQPQKLPKDPTVQSEERKFIGIFLTEARVEKLMYKMVDEGIVDELAIENIGTILKSLVQSLFDDLLKEERDELPAEIDEREIRKSIGKVAPPIVKSILSKIGGM